MSSRKSRCSNGAYPERHGNRTAAEIDFLMREGSRDRVQSHLSVSAIDASGVVEGPIGGSKRGRGCSPRAKAISI